MQAEAVKQDLRMIRECLAQCSAESQRHKELLWRLVGVECSPCPWGLGAARPEPLTPPFPTQGKKRQELQETMEQLSMKVSVPSSAHVPQLRWLGLCQGLSASVRLLFPELCRGAAFQKQPPGAPAAGGAGGPDKGEFTEPHTG